MIGLPFKPVTLTWKGEDYEVSPDRVWGLIGAIENVISRNKLVVKLHERDIPETKVAEAYAAALTYAGAKRVFPYDITIGSTPDQLYLHAFALFEILNLAVQPAGFETDEPASGESKPASPATTQRAKRPIKSGQ
jgi:hypothetical protein